MAARRAACGLLSVIGQFAMPQAATAQLSGSGSIASDYRLRGLSLNGGGAALTAAVGYDDASGVYGGVSATAGDTRRFGIKFLSHAAYLGYAARINPQLSWDVGVSRTQVFSNVANRFSGDYPEVHAGVSSERASLRAAYSPSFIASGLQTIYLDANYALRPAAWLRVFAHGGLLIPVGGSGDRVLPRARTDLRIGAAATLRRAEVQVAWVRSGAGDAFLRDRRQSRNALIVGGSFFF